MRLANRTYSRARVAGEFTIVASPRRRVGSFNGYGIARSASRQQASRRGYVAPERTPTWEHGRLARPGELGRTVRKITGRAPR